MVDAEVVARRLLALNEALQHLDAHPAATEPDRLRADATLRAAVERWLQVAIEACIDLAYHVAAERGWTPSETARAAFLALASHGILTVDLAKRLGLAAGLRNVLVHDYADVDLTILAGVVASDLDDLRECGNRIGALLRSEPPA
jgi:uncharacterized protein YutE (UPF0331/DUF86 family)